MAELAPASSPAPVVPEKSADVVAPVAVAPVDPVPAPALPAEPVSKPSDPAPAQAPVPAPAEPAPPVAAPAPASDPVADLVAAKLRVSVLEKRFASDQDSLLTLQGQLDTEKAAHADLQKYCDEQIAARDAKIKDLSGQLADEKQQHSELGAEFDVQKKQLAEKSTLAQEQDANLTSLRAELLKALQEIDSQTGLRKLAEAAKAKADADVADMNLQVAGHKAKVELLLQQISEKDSAALDAAALASKEKADLSKQLHEQVIAGMSLQAKIADITSKRYQMIARGQFLTINALPEDMEFVESRRPWTAEKFGAGIYLLRSTSSQQAEDALQAMGYKS